MLTRRLMATRGSPEDQDPLEEVTPNMPLENSISGPLGLTMHKEAASEANRQASESPTQSLHNLYAPDLSRSSSSDVELSAIREAVDRLTVTEPNDDQMFRALEDIFRNAQDYERSINTDYNGTENLWNYLRNANAASERGDRDIQALRIVQRTLSQMVWNESRLVVVAARTLADAARDRKQPTFLQRASLFIHNAEADHIFVASWRLPFGESGILDLFFQILGIETIPDELAVHSLRLLGNSCSDTGNYGTSLSSPELTSQQTRTGV